MAQVSKSKAKVRKVKGFTKPKSTIMIEGQRDSEVGEVDKGRRRDLVTQEERAGKKKKKRKKKKKKKEEW